MAHNQDNYEVLDVGDDEKVDGEEVFEVVFEILAILDLKCKKSMTVEV